MPPIRNIIYSKTNLQIPVAVRAITVFFLFSLFGIFIGNSHEKEAADFLAVAVKTLRNWRNLCKGPAYKKIGRLVRYSTADLAAYAEKTTVHAIQR